MTGRAVVVMVRMPTGGTSPPSWLVPANARCVNASGTGRAGGGGHGDRLPPSWLRAPAPRAPAHVDVDAVVFGALLRLPVVAAAAALVAGVVAMVTRELGDPIQFRPTREQREFFDAERRPYETESDTARRIFEAGVQAIKEAGQQP